MSTNGNPPPPDHGGDNFFPDDPLPPLRRHRPGTGDPFTARADATARHLSLATRAGTIGPGPVVVGLAAELRALSDKETAQRLAGHMPERARVVGAHRAATLAAGRAGEDHQAATARVAQLERDDPGEPPLGTRLTHPVLPWIVIAVLALLEITLTASSIRPALATTNLTATLAAGAIAFVSLFVASKLGATLGSITRERTRLARLVALLIAISMVAFVGSALGGLVNSREANTTYRECIKPKDSSTGDTVGAGFGVGGTTGSDGRTQAGPDDTRKCGTPDLGFILPLSLAAVLLEALVSMRCTMAHRHQDWERDIWSARNDARSANDRLTGAQRAETAAAEAHDASDLQIGAVSEQEDARVRAAVARCQNMYVTFCLALAVVPLTLIIDDPADGDQRPIWIRLVDPDRPTSTQPIVVPTQLVDDAPNAERQPPAPDPRPGEPPTAQRAAPAQSGDAPQPEPSSRVDAPAPILDPERPAFLNGGPPATVAPETPSPPDQPSFPEAGGPVPQDPGLPPDEVPDPNGASPQPAPADPRSPRRGPAGDASTNGQASLRTRWAALGLPAGWAELTPEDAPTDSTTTD